MAMITFSWKSAAVENLTGKFVKFVKDWTTDGTCIFFNGTFEDFFSYFFLWLLSAQGQCILEKVKDKTKKARLWYT